MGHGKYGFRVGHPLRWAGEKYEYGPVESEWVVYLPHQCDSWDIAGEDAYGVPHEDAVWSLKQFIAEAEAALRRLQKREADVDD